MIAFNEAHETGDALLRAGDHAQAEAKGPLTEEAYLTALERIGGCHAPRGSTPSWRNTGWTPWSRPRAARPGSPTTSTAITTPAAIRRPPRSPAIRASPCPRVTCRGLPVGISFIGTAWRDPALIRFAYAFEQATSRPPARRGSFTRSQRMTTSLAPGMQAFTPARSSTSAGLPGYVRKPVGDVTWADSISLRRYHRGRSHFG